MFSEASYDLPFLRPYLFFIKNKDRTKKQKQQKNRLFNDFF